MRRAVENRGICVTSTVGYDSNANGRAERAVQFFQEIADPGAAPPQVPTGFLQGVSHDAQNLTLQAENVALQFLCFAVVQKLPKSWICLETQEDSQGLAEVPY